MGYSYWNGAEAAHRRVMMKAAGYSDEDIRKKPHIGVCTSVSTFLLQVVNGLR